MIFSKDIDLSVDQIIIPSTMCHIICMTPLSLLNITPNVLVNTHNIQHYELNTCKENI